MKTSLPIACVLVPSLPIVAHHAPAKVKRENKVGACETLRGERAVHRGKGNQAQVMFCNERARRAGIVVGQRLAAAKARAPNLRSIAFDEECIGNAKNETIARLVAISPRIQADGFSRFWVEPLISPTQTLQQWCASAHAALPRLSPTFIGVGATATIAWAAAKQLQHSPILQGELFSEAATLNTKIIPVNESRAFLDASPITFLELEHEAIACLSALGVQSIGQFRAFEPRDLRARFGPEVAAARLRIDGHDPRRPQTPKSARSFEVMLELDDELQGQEPLIFLLRPATQRLTQSLRSQGLGAMTVELTLSLRGSTSHLVILRTSSPLDNGHALLELFRTRLENEQIPAPIVGIKLAATSITEARSRERSLFGGLERDLAAREVALERIRSRFGIASVRRSSRVEVGSPFHRAAWVSNQSRTTEVGEALPWRHLETPSHVHGGHVWVAGRRRRVLKLSRLERTTSPWWHRGEEPVQLTAWAELEGPLIALLHARSESPQKGQWEVIAWVD